jgi:hypothetical protein
VTQVGDLAIRWATTISVVVLAGIAAVLSYKHMRPGVGLVAGSSLSLFGVVLSLALPAAQLFVGLDWASQVHAVCVMDAGGRIVSQFPGHGRGPVGKEVGRVARGLLAFCTEGGEGRARVRRQRHGLEVEAQVADDGLNGF